MDPRHMRDRFAHKMSPMLSSDEAPDTEGDSDEDLITSYLSGDPGAHLHAYHEVIPTINIAPHSPNSNRILEDNLMQLAEIHENIQRMRLENAESQRVVVSNDKSESRLSNSCPSLNADEAVGSDSNSNVTSAVLNKKSPAAANVSSGHRRRGRGANNNQSANGEFKSHRKRVGRQRSLSASSGDSDDVGFDRSSEVDSPAKSRQRSSSSIALARSSAHRTPEAANKPAHGRSSKKPPQLLAQFPALQKSISTPSIVVQRDDQRTHHSGKAGSPALPEPTHVFIQNLIAQHEWTARRSGTESESEEDHPPDIGGSLRFITENTPSPQLSLAEFLQDPPLEDEEQRKRRRKKERGSIFFRKKKEKKFSTTDVKSLAKAPSAISLGTKPVGGVRAPQHSYSMSSLRKSSLAAHPGSGNFYILKSDIHKPEDRNDYVAAEETTGLIEGEFALSSEEFPEGPATIRYLDTDPFLRIEDDEPENWQQTRRPEDIQDLRSVDIKRQEHIYEFIITESNHCQVLQAVKKIFVEGMYKYLNLSQDIVQRIFPCMDLLIDIHFQFLRQLRIRQNEGPVVSTISDILLQQFSGRNAEQWRKAYGTFCSQHSDAVSLYKDIMKSDRRFQQFVKQCLNNPLLKKKGISECILFVTTRITKYPLLIEPLVKTSKDHPEEQAKLRHANNLVKGILNDVNAKVAEKERDQRLIEIYNRIDAKSSIVHGGKKFKKSDVLSRRLMFEGQGVLQQARSRNIQVHIIVLSDIVLFLQENSQKFYFITPESKPGVVPVRTLIAREKTGPSTKALYLISTSEKEPEMYEIEIQQPPTRDDWIRGIRDAVDACAPGSDSDGQASEDEIRKHVEAKYIRMRHLTTELRTKDHELARLLEEKMRVMSDMLTVLGTPDPLRDNLPDYVGLVTEKESNYTKEELLKALQEASRLASSLYSSGTNLSRSVSSAGERHSSDYVSPILPKRAETFGGFDNSANAPPLTVPQDKKLSEIQEPPAEDQQQQVPPAPKRPEWMEGLPTIPPLLHLDPEQQQAAVHMTHYLNSLMCMVSEHFTSLESLKIELAETRERASMIGGRYKHNQQLEELRNLQDKLSQERVAFQQEKEAFETDHKFKRENLKATQSEVERGLKDVQEQREQLYRKLEALKAQGIELGPNMTVLKADLPAPPPQHDAFIMEVKRAGTGSTEERTISPTNNNRKPVAQAAAAAGTGTLTKKDNVNVHLLSTTNESKGEKPDIRQQIPVKLSKLSSGSGSSKDRKEKKNSTINLKQVAAAVASNSTQPKPSSDSIQQLLPFKLSESSDAASKRSSPKQMHGSSYQKLSSSSFVEERRPLSTTATPPEISHHRTGSSPALIQAKPMSNTLPKSTSLNSSTGSSTVKENEEKVFFF